MLDKINHPLGVVMLLAAASTMCVGTAESVNEQCLRTVIDKKPPTWASSIAWRNQAENSFIIADGIDDILRPYTTRGRYIPTTGKAATYHPNQLQRIEGGYLLEEDGDVFRRLRNDFEPVGEPVTLQGVRGHNSYTIGTANGFAYSELHDRLITFSFLQNSDGAWLSAFLSIPLGRPEEFVILDKVDGVVAGSKLYLMGLDLLTLGPEGRVYAISYLHESPELLVLNEALTDATAHSLHDIARRFPDSLGFELDNFAPPAAQFAVLQRADFVTGIYASSNHEELFLLRRRPAEANSTTFTLTRIDTANGFAAGHPITLPTQESTAHHLSILFGRTELLVLERGTVVDIGDQEIHSVLLIPTSWISGPRSLERAIDLRSRRCRE